MEQAKAGQEAQDTKAMFDIEIANAGLQDAGKYATEQYKIDQTATARQIQDNIRTQQNKLNNYQNSVKYVMNQFGVPNNRTDDENNRLFDEQKIMLDGMVKSGDETMHKLALNYDYNMTGLNRKLDELTSSTMGQMWYEVQLANKTGAMDTVKGMKDVRAGIIRSLGIVAEHTNKYYQDVAAMNEFYKTEMDRKFQYDQLDQQQQQNAWTQQYQTAQMTRQDQQQQIALAQAVQNGTLTPEQAAQFGYNANAGQELGDLSSLGYNADGTPKANGYAWAKNNNPAGISWNAGFDNPTP